MDEAYQEKDSLVSELEQMNEKYMRCENRISELEEKNNELMEDCVRLSGNQNPHEKIKYMQKLKRVRLFHQRVSLQLSPLPFKNFRRGVSLAHWFL